jgi:hypothetical protein
MRELLAYAKADKEDFHVDECTTTVCWESDNPHSYRHLLRYSRDVLIECLAEPLENRFSLVFTVFAYSQWTGDRVPANSYRMLARLVNRLHATPPSIHVLEKADVARYDKYEPLPNGRKLLCLPGLSDWRVTCRHRFVQETDSKDEMHYYIYIFERK